MNWSNPVNNRSYANHNKMTGPEFDIDIEIPVRFYE